jgi:hypothetical protein
LSELTYAQKQTLHENGFVKLPGIVPHTLVDDALRAINASLGGEGIDPTRLTTFRSHLAHYQLAHGIALNVSPFIRYGIFFRLIHKNHDAWQWVCMTNIWGEWAGMQELVASSAS